MNPTQTNPNDFKVVSFHNTTDFGFTSELGCMYNGIPINGKSGLGIQAGETMILPFHIGNQLALNLAKAAMLRGDGAGKPQLDANGQPIIKSLWSDDGLEKVKNSFLKELYTEEKPATMSQTDILLAKLEEYKKLTDDKIASLSGNAVVPVASNANEASSYQDKAEVIAELEKRGIAHNKRSSKDTLEKLLA